MNVWHNHDEPERARCNLSVVVPAYNEVERLPNLLAALANDPLTSAPTTEIIVVDDGSTDGTAVVARQTLQDFARALVVTLPSNTGKGAALRAGVAAARGERMVFMDADLATSLQCLPGLLQALQTHHVAVGSRSVPGSVVHNGSPTRRLMGTVYNRMLRMVTNIDVSDSQCGFKAFRGPTARLLFALSALDGFGHDAELLDLAGHLNLSVTEIPVEWTNQPGSKVVPLRHSAQTALELFRHSRTRGSSVAITSAPHRADSTLRRTDPVVSGHVLFPLLASVPKRLELQPGTEQQLSWDALTSLFG